MKHVFLTAAAALLAGTALAGAQGMDSKKEGASPAPAAQQRAPAEKIAPAHNAQTPRAGKPAETTGQAQHEPAGKVEMKDNAQTKGQGGKADVDVKGNANTKMNDDKAGNKSALDSKTQMDEKNKMSADDKTKAGADKNGNNNARVDEKNKSTAQDNNKMDNKTTGQGAAGARSVNLNTEQRTKIRTVIKEKVHAQPLTKVNFSVSIGTRVPRDVHFYPLPPEIISVYPAWRGYEFVLVGDQIIVIDPATYEIVEIIT